jgi:hypothetical protein
MKQKIYILGVVSAIILITGTMFKFQHWAGAAILLSAGTVLLLTLFLPAALLNHYNVNGNKKYRLLYIIVYTTCLVVFTSMLFKIQHWPYAGYLMYLAVPFPFVVFLPAWLYFTAKIKNFDINNTIYILFLLALQSVFSVLLSLNVSKEKIDNTIQLAMQLSSQNAKLENLQAGTDNPAVIRSADEALVQIGVCRQLIYERTGITREGLNRRTTGDKYLYSADIAPAILRLPVEASPAGKLESLLRNFIAELGKLPKSQKLTEQALDIFELTEAGSQNISWSEEIFVGKPLVWTLVDLDSFENFIRVLKLEVIN